METVKQAGPFYRLGTQWTEAHNVLPGDCVSIWNDTRLAVLAVDSEGSIVWVYCATGNGFKWYRLAWTERVIREYIVTRGVDGNLVRA